jgi:signal recognition particle subunit SEC65
MVPDKTSKSEFDKLKFARDAYTIGRHPSIKDGLGFKREAKNLTSHKAPIPAKEKGKAPMTSSAQKNHAFMYHDRRYSRNVHHDRSCNAYDSNVMFASSSSYVHGRDMPRKIVIHHMPRRNIAHVPRKINEPSTIYHARSCNAYDSNAMFASSSSYVHGRDMPRKNVIHHMPRRNIAHVPRKINEPSTIYHACNASFAICRKDKKVIARKLGAKCKGDKTCIWVPKTIVTNLVGPNKSWVPKTQA